MARNKEKELKDFLVSERKKLGPGVSNAPVWVLRKAEKRIWNRVGKRHWRKTDFGVKFRKRKNAIEGAKSIKGVGDKRERRMTKRTREAKGRGRRKGRMRKRRKKGKR